MAAAPVSVARLRAPPRSGLARRRPASRSGSAGGSGSRAAGRSGSAAPPGCSGGRWCAARSSSAAARACRGGPARRRPARASPSSAIWPAYMTATRSQASATIPRLWVISSSAVSKFSRRSARMPRICASTITSSAVVGSSAITSFGFEHERQGDHDPLAHAARELVRVLLEAGRRDAHARQRLERPPAHLLRLRAPARALRASRGSGPRSSPAGRGASSAPGRSGPSSGPRSSRSSLRRESDQVAARDSAPRRRSRRCRAAGRGSPGPRVDFPQPDSPTRPSVSPGRISSETPSTARTGSPSVPYQTRRLRTREDRAGRAHPARRLSRSPAPASGGDLGARRIRRSRISGLSTSLRPSPTRVKPGDQEHDREAREEPGPPDARAGVVDRPVHVVAPLGGLGRLDPVAEEAERRQGEDRVGGVQGRDRGHVLDHVVRARSG